ncbi:hypothetical protein AXA44_34600 [Rhodococcus sp. SC4]|nr:hypothetical protein AXA44_34600 [Rhodococcus sp. SC4]
MIRGVHHTSLTTSDLEASLAFYSGLLGCAKVMDAEWDNSADADRIVGLTNAVAKGVILRTGNSYLEILQYFSPEPRPLDPTPRACDIGLRHICFDVVDIEDEYARLSSAGVEFISPPQEMFNMLKSCYGRDPDGNIFELQELVRSDTEVGLEVLPFIGPGISALTNIRP